VRWAVESAGLLDRYPWQNLCGQRTLRAADGTDPLLVSPRAANRGFQGMVIRRFSKDMDGNAIDHGVLRAMVDMESNLSVTLAPR